MFEGRKCCGSNVHGHCSRGRRIHRPAGGRHRRGQHDDYLGFGAPRRSACAAGEQRSHQRPVPGRGPHPVLPRRAPECLIGGSDLGDNASPTGGRPTLPLSVTPLGLGATVLISAIAGLCPRDPRGAHASDGGPRVAVAAGAYEAVAGSGNPQSKAGARAGHGLCARRSRVRQFCTGARSSMTDARRRVKQTLDLQEA